MLTSEHLERVHKYVFEALAAIKQAAVMLQGLPQELQASPANEPISASQVGPGKSNFRILASLGHKSLKCGDIVRVVEDPIYNNLILRISDLTLHSMRNADEEYVVLVPA